MLKIIVTFCDYINVQIYVIKKLFYFYFILYVHFVGVFKT